MGKMEWPDGRALGKIKSLVVRAEDDLRPKPRSHKWSLAAHGWRCTECGARRHRNTKARCKGIFDLEGINVDHRFLRKADSPDGIPIVFCAKCGGARAGRTGGLVKSCRVMRGSAGAAKDRLKRLGEGRHPYKQYTYMVHSLGPVGDSWETRERVDGHPLAGMLYDMALDGALSLNGTMVLGRSFPHHLEGGLFVCSNSMRPTLLGIWRRRWLLAPMLVRLRTPLAWRATWMLHSFGAWVASWTPQAVPGQPHPAPWTPKAEPGAAGRAAVRVRGVSRRFGSVVDLWWHMVRKRFAWRFCLVACHGSRIGGLSGARGLRHVLAQRACRISFDGVCRALVLTHGAFCVVHVIRFRRLIGCACLPSLGHTPGAPVLGRPRLRTAR